MTRTASTLALLALLLAACTGTTEPRPPTLLVIGTVQGDQPRLILVEDVSATAPRGQPRLAVVPGGGRPLLAPAVALDFEDRGLTRPAAWVLTRSVTDAGGAPAVTAHLQRFSTADVDPAGPSAFAEDAAARVTLTAPGGGGVLDGLSLTSPATCPTALQVDRAGTFAVVLDDPASCGGADHAELWLVPLDGSDPRTLEGTNPVAPLPAYLDQRGDDQAVYFLVDAISSTHVYVHTSSSGDTERLTNVTLPARASDLRAAAGAGDLLVALSAQDLLTARLDGLEPPVRSATRADADELVADPTGVAPELLALDGTALAFHTDPADRTPNVAQRPAVAATIDPLIRFAYVVGQGAVTIVDLLTGGDTGRTFQAHLELLPEVELPAGAPASLPGADTAPVGVIGWFRAVAPVPP